MNELLEKLSQIEFASLDLQLYLNTHPYDKEAIKKFNEYNTEATKLKAEYENKYGPLYSTDATYDNYFSWINDPWPWEKSFAKKAD